MVTAFVLAKLLYVELTGMGDHLQYTEFIRDSRL